MSLKLPATFRACSVRIPALQGMMSFVVSGIATLGAMGFVEGFTFSWITSWLGSWAVAFPVVLIVAPFVRRIVALVCHGD